MKPSKLARIFKALSNPNRLELFLEIRRQQQAGFESERGCLVSEIMQGLRVGAPTVSHHLKELASAGLVVTERQGKFVVARADEEVLAEARKALGGS